MACVRWTMLFPVLLLAMVLVIMETMATSTELGGRSKRDDASAAASVLSDDAFRKKCRKMLMVMGKKHFKTFANCTKEVQARYPDKEEFSKHFQCAIRCTMIATKFTDENMMVTDATVERFFKDEIPVDYHDVARVAYAKCVKEWVPKLDPKDEFCQSYGHFGKCIQDFVGSHCTPKDKEKDAPKPKARKS